MCVCVWGGGGGGGVGGWGGGGVGAWVGACVLACLRGWVGVGVFVFELCLWAYSAVKAQEVEIEILACASPCTNWLLAVCGKQVLCDWEDAVGDPFRTL